MSRMVSVRTEELTGPALAWAIESIEGAPPAAGQLQLPLAQVIAEQLASGVSTAIDTHG